SMVSPGTMRKSLALIQCGLSLRSLEVSTHCQVPVGASPLISPPARSHPLATTSTARFPEVMVVSGTSALSLHSAKVPPLMSKAAPAAPAMIPVVFFFIFRLLLELPDPALDPSGGVAPGAP